MGNMEKGRKTGTEKTVTEKRGSIMEKNRKWFSANDGKAGETDMKLRFRQKIHSGITAWRRRGAAAALLAAAVLAAGCGKQQGATTAQKEFVYVPEYVKLDMEDGIDQMKVVGDTIYFVSGHWDDATSTYQRYIGKLEAGERTPEKVVLDIGEESSMMASDIDAEGNLQAVVITALFAEDETPGAGNAAEDAKDGDAGAEDAKDGDAGSEDAEDGDAGAEDAKDGDAGSEDAEDGDAGAEDAKDGDAGAEDAEDGDAGAEDAESETSKETGEDGEASDASESGSVSIVGGSAGTVQIVSGTGNFSVDEASASSVDGEMEYREPIGQKTELWKFGQDGKVTETVDLTQVFEGKEDFYIQNMVTDGEGNLYFGFDRSIFVLDRDGNMLFETELDSWINSLSATGDGQVLVSYWGEQMEIHTIDLAGKKMGDAVNAMQTNRFGSYTFSQGAGVDVLYSVDSNLYSYNFGDAEAVELLNWIDCDIDQDNLRGFTLLEDGRVLAVTSSWDGEGAENQVELAYLTKKKGSEVPEKKILTYGTLMMDYDLRKNIIEFNRTNQEYRIEVKEYYTDYTGEDSYTNAVQMMNADIVSGKCPDIIDFSNGNVENYIAKGVVEDLYPFMEADAEINKEDYLENVLRAYEKNGKLYAMPPRFYISTVMAKVADVGDKQHITLEEIMELSKNLPEGVQLYQYASKNTVLGNIFRMNMDVFVNWETGECKFNGEEFIRALEFANTFPDEYSWSEDAPSTPTMIREGKLVMMEVSFSSMQEFQMYTGMYGEPVTFIGFPTSKESGTYLNSAGALLAMSSKSPYQEGVWQFIRMSLTKEAQEKLTNRSYGFPVMKSALDKMFEKDMEEEYYEGPDGEKVKQPKTTWGYDDFSIEIYAATEDEVAAVRKLMESANSSFRYDVQMNNIIEEETAAFFEGQKSAKDVADIIQSRVQIYVNENR